MPDRAEAALRKVLEAAAISLAAVVERFPRMLTARFAPPYSQIFAGKPRGGEVPLLGDGVFLAATRSLVAIGCLPDIDGETAFTLGLASAVDPGREPTFDCVLETPGRTIALSTAELEVVLEMPVPAEKMRVRVWTNHPSWPDEVIVGVSAAAVP